MRNRQKLRQPSHATVVAYLALSENTVQGIAAQAYLTAGDSISVFVLHSDGVSLEIGAFTSVTVEANPEFAMTWLAPGPGS